MKAITKGLAMHVHHDILFEYCYDFDERVNAIKKNKPENEQEIRLRLFKMLPEEAITELPKKLLKADAEWQKAYAEWKKASAEWQKAYAEFQKAYAEWQKASAEWKKASAEWPEKEAWHAKWCGCKEWNGEEIIFKK